MKQMDDSSCKAHIKQTQLLLQPAFAITGHSAQGRTLKKVLINLRDGGNATYVGASCATNCQGLYIIEPVRIEDLNKPLHLDLLFEVCKFKAMFTNTHICHGFASDELLPMPNAESETGIKPHLHARFKDLVSHGTKRKHEVKDDPQDKGKQCCAMELDVNGHE